MNNPKSVDEHINTLGDKAREKVESIRSLVHTLVPDAVECIKYGIPTFTLYGKNLLHFAGYKAHVGFYPAPSGIEAFKKDLAPYITGKGTIQFPLDTPLPVQLIRKVVLFRVNETLQKVKRKNLSSGHLLRI